MMQKLLVSGAGGFVGARVMHLWRGQAELTIFPRGFLAAATEEEVIRFAAQVQPDVILHLAALSDTGYCQRHPEESRRANVELPCWMAKAARAAGAKLVAFSSDQVYAGVTQDGPLAETLPLSPANVYGQHKLEAEQRALELLPDAVFLRVPWMYDFPGNDLPIRGNLPLNLLRAAQDGTPVQFSQNDWRGVSFVREVIENLRSALALPGGGVQLRQRERCQHGRDGEAVCRADGHHGEARTRRLAPRPADGRQQSRRAGHPLPFHAGRFCGVPQI